ncbi:MAG: acetate kinase [Planctomycetota bacterium]|jgi:acetate kinase|nr:acetate kinase [Planctomycetota bacterium]
MIVLVINCGSSSIKYQLYDMPSKIVLAKGLVEKIGENGSSLTHRRGEEKFEINQPIPNHKTGIELILTNIVGSERGVIASVKEIGAVGHRIVHGGERYSAAMRIDQDVLSCIEDCCDLAPLHNPPNLIGIQECRNALPDVPMVAVFDTAFHQTLPREAFLYPLPYGAYERYRIRKYGFHGTSHAFVANRAASILGKPEQTVNLITCHLGNGSSMAAVRGGKSVDTSMGFTPLAGLMMGTRSGDIDPAIIPFLMSKPEYAKVSDVDRVLNKKSGLLGISGVSNDMRDLQEAATREGSDSRAALAINMFCYRVKSYIGQYLAVLGRVDAICFMGGIGENGVLAREKSLSGLDNFGIILDREKNKEMVRGKEGEISVPGSKVKILVIPTDEEGWIAVETFHRAQ